MNTIKFDQDVLTVILGFWSFNNDYAVFDVDFTILAYGGNQLSSAGLLTKLVVPCSTYPSFVTSATTCYVLDGNYGADESSGTIAINGPISGLSFYVTVTYPWFAYTVSDSHFA